MADVEVRGTARMGFHHLDQDHRIKPTSAFGLIDSLLPDIWRELAGVSRDTYFATHPARLVFSHLRIELTHAQLGLDQEARLAFDNFTGIYRGRDGRPRHGLKDHFTVASASGETALRWTAEVFWIHADGALAGRPLEEPPPGLRHDQSRELEGPPPRPEDTGEPAGTFRWTPRETDFNRHVYFQSYLERAENALADACHDPAGPTVWDVWFARPAFLGDEMTASIASADGTHTIALRRGEDVCCMIQAH